MNAESVSLLAALRADAGLRVALGLCIGPLAVLAILALIMRSAGVSLRPLLFIGGLLLPITLSFFIGQLVRARAPAPASPPMALAVRDGHFVDRAALFGPGIRPDLIRDAKRGLPGILDEAEVAEVGVTPSGETVLIAQFADSEQARRAAAAYQRGFGLGNGSGDEEQGWRATRLQGDYIEMLRSGRQLFVWSGLTREAAAARRAASNLGALSPSLQGAVRPPLFPVLQPLAEFFAPLWIKLGGLLLVTGVYVVLFIKGIGWAGSAPAAAGTVAVSASSLVARLLAINDTGVPFTIAKGEAPGELFADWRYADARWLDLARIHGMRKAFHIRLLLDETSHSVRATDYTAEFDAAAGRSAASIEWKAAKGVVFFQKEQQSVLGLQLDERGHPRRDPSYTYRFDLDEMKSPLIAIVTQSGWNWRPSPWWGMGSSQSNP